MSGDHNMHQKPRSYDDDTQYDEAQIQAMIRKAIRDEREACAKVVEDYCGAWDDEGYALAAAIRAREKQ